MIQRFLFGDNDSVRHFIHYIHKYIKKLTEQYKYKIIREILKVRPYIT